MAYIKQNVKVGMPVRYIGAGMLEISAGYTGPVTAIKHTTLPDLIQVKWPKYGLIWTLCKNIEII